MTTLEAIRASKTAEELAEALRVWAIESADAEGGTPQRWVEQLQRYMEGRGDESHGMTLEELIPEAIDEWRRVREDR